MSSTGPDRDATGVVGARIGAQIIDLVLMVVQIAVVVILLGSLLRPEREVDGHAIVWTSFLTLPLYGGLLEGYWNGQTVGKRRRGIKVVDSSGRDPSVGQAVVRNLPAVILFSWITTVVALAVMAMSDRRQRLFDVVADTYVVGA